MLQVPRTLLLDLEGTLVDMVPGLTLALNRLDPTPTFRDEEVAAMLGGGLDSLLERACTARRQQMTPELMTAFVGHFLQYGAEACRTYADVLPTLRRMMADGWDLAVCTEIPEQIANTLLQIQGFSGLFSAVVGADTFGSCKPDPKQLLATLAAVEGDIEQAVMVGDRTEDVMAARSAGLLCIFVGWGYGKLSMASGASALAVRFSDVHGLAARLLAPIDE
jgi:phosphoglycolate phosphatase